MRIALLRQLNRFLADHANLKLDMLSTNSPSALLELGLDVLLRIGRLDDSGLVALPLGWVDFVVCASPSYLKTRGVPQHPDDLARHDAIVYAMPDEAPSTRWELHRGDESCIAAVPIRLVVRDPLCIEGSSRCRRGGHRNARAHLPLR